MRFTDRPAYDRYARAFPAVIKRFKATVLAADEQPVVLEGEWPHQKVVLLEFPDEAEAHRFETDPEYARIAQARRAGTDGVILRVRGF